MSSEELNKKIDACCDRFESEFQKGNAPDIEQFLAGFDLSDRRSCLRELLALERELIGDVLFDEKQKSYLDRIPEVEYILDEFTFESEREETKNLDSEDSSNKPTRESDSSFRNQRDKIATEAIVGNYKLLEPIGEGGMGSVWKAVQVHPVRRDVAIKIIKSGLDSKEVIARFEAERQALAMMDHPNIARILDAGTTGDGQPFFAMELVTGIPLNEYCDQNNLNLPQRLRLFSQICDAVQHAHQKGIIHRDLKPGNILVAEYDGKPTPKVIDFGLAKALAPSQKLTDKSLFTEFGQILGTLKYMSPEQAGLDSLDIDTRSDIYSLGVILYELLTGSTPLESDTLAGQALINVLAMIREHESPRPSIRLAETKKTTLTDVTRHRSTSAKRLGTILLGDLDWIVMKSLEKDRRRRYETASAFSLDIQNYLNDDLVAARPPSINYKVKKFVLKNKGLVSAAGLLMLTIGLGLAGTIWFAIESNEATKESNKARLIAEQEKQIAIDEQIAGEQVLTYFVSTFRSPDPWVNGVDVKMVDALKAAFNNLEDGMLQNNARAKAAFLAALGESLGALGQYDEALDANERALNLYAEIEGTDPDMFLKLRERLAACHRNLGNYDEAISALDEIIAAQLTRNGKESAPYIGAVTDKVIALRRARKFESSLKLARENYEASKEHLGADESTTLNAMNNLAANLIEAGNFEEAETLLDELLRRRRESLPVNHPDTITTLNLLSAVTRAKGDWAGYLQLSQQVYDARAESLGKEHPSTLVAINNLAIAWSQMKEFEKAFGLARQAAEVYSEKLGADHPRAISLTANAGALALRAGAPDTAVEILEPLLKLAVEEFGPTDPLTIDINGHYAQALYSSGKTVKGLDEYRNVVERCRKQEPNGGALTDLHVKRLISKLNKEWEFEELIPLLEHKVDEAVSSKNLQAKLDLAESYLRTNAYQRAKTAYEELAAFAANHEALNQQETLARVHFLAKMYQAEAMDQIGEKEAAARIASEARSYFESVPGAETTAAFAKITHARCDAKMDSQKRLELLDQAESKLESAGNVPDKLRAYYQNLILDGRASIDQ